MAISDKTRKILWAKSGNRCAYCKAVLIHEINPAERSVIGEECHIRSLKPSGSRHDSCYPPEQIDLYDNLILMCAVHHKVVDDLPDTFTVNLLTTLKSEHEEWVNKSLSQKNKETLPTHLMRVESGQHLVGLISISEGLLHSYGDNFSQNETLMVASFSELVFEYIEVYDILSITEQIESHNLFNLHIKELEEASIWVFAETSNKIVGKLPLKALVLGFHKSDDSAIIRFPKFKKKEDSNE